VLTRTTTLHTLLGEYPFLDDFLVSRHPFFARLGDSDASRRWLRVAALQDVAVAMDLPWLDLLREIQAEIGRVTGAAPAIAGAAPGPAEDSAMGDDVLGVLRELAHGTSIGALAARIDELTGGLDAEEVAAVARSREREAGVRAASTAGIVGPVSGWPAALTALGPSHPLRALERERSRLAALASLVEGVVEAIGDPPDEARWHEAGPAFGGLVAKLGDMERQGRRLRLAWYPVVAARIGPSIPEMVGERVGEAVEALDRARATTGPGEVAAAVAVALARAAVAAVRRALDAEEEFLAPAAFRALDDDDWADVAGQEGAAGWALDAGQEL